MVGKITYEQNIAKVSRCSQSLQIFPRPKDQDEENLQILLKHRPHGKADKENEIQLLKSPHLSATSTTTYMMLIPKAYSHTSAKIQTPFLIAYGASLPGCSLSSSLHPKPKLSFVFLLQIYTLIFVTPPFIIPLNFNQPTQHLKVCTFREVWCQATIIIKHPHHKKTLYLIIYAVIIIMF